RLPVAPRRETGHGSPGRNGPVGRRRGEPTTLGGTMLEHVILMLSLIGSGHVGVTTIFGSSHWDRSNPHSRLACLHREIDDRKDFIIAHNSLPCGKKVWLFNPRTGLSTLAEVADRGPRHA